MATILPNAFPPSVSSPVRSLLERLYQHSNLPATHATHESNEKQFVSLFTDDGIYEFAGKMNKGHKEILEFREFLFKNVPNRARKITQVFQFGEDDMQLMAFAKSYYNFEDGSTHEREFAGRYEIVKGKDGKLKFKKVQIIINPAHPDEKDM